jgi:hypothetical protein
MWIIVAFGLVGVWLWQSNKRRAKRFVRSVCFLDLVDGSASANEANGQVARLFTMHSKLQNDDAATAFAIGRAQQFTDGKQLPWIHLARERGFVVDSGNTRFDMAHKALPKLSKSGQGKSSKFTEQFSARVSITESDQPFPRTVTKGQPRTAYFLGVALEQNDLVNRCWVLIDLLFKWAVVGGGVGFLCSLVVPAIGPLREVETLVIPPLTAFIGAWLGVLTGLCYYLLHWVYTK